jgi:hypothetical protein
LGFRHAFAAGRPTPHSATPRSRLSYFILKNYLRELTKTVRKRHGQEAEYIQTVLVNQITEENTVWNILVEVFGLRWNPKAKRCYAWGQVNAEGGWDITTVLETRPITSAHSAVKAALGAKAKHFAA